MIRQFGKTLERPQTRAAPSPRENPHQQFASVGFLLLQQPFNCRILHRAGPERGRSRDVLDPERFEQVEITIDEMSSLYFPRRLRFEVREKVERTIGTS